MKKILLGLGIIIIGFLIITLSLTFTSKSKQPVAQKQELKINEERAINHLSEAVQFKTISTEKEDEIDYEQFEKFITYLEKTYPRI